MLPEGMRTTAGRSLRSGLLLCALCISALAGPVGAEIERFRVALPVADQGAEARRAAEREAFATVLVRITGRETALAHPALRSALREPQRYFTSSGYERRSPRERLLDPESRPWSLVLEFDERSIMALLAEEDIPVWNTRRPDILLWMLAEDETGDRRLLGATDPEGIAVRERAERRGLDVLLPVLDLTELAAFPMADAWAGYGDAVQAASMRYRSEAVLTLRIYPDPLGRWIVDWRGDIAGERLEGALEVDDPAQGAARMLDAIADALADRYAISLDASNGADSVWLQVDRVSTISEYAALMRYLESTSGVLAVQIVQMQGTSLLLRVDIADTELRLLDLLRLEARLLPEATSARVGDVAVWRARWRGPGASR